MNRHLNDRYGYERRLLRYMIELRTRDGTPVISDAGLLIELAEDAAQFTSVDLPGPEELRRWAFGDGESHGGAPLNLCFAIERAYRGLVGAFPYKVRPDWMCAEPSKCWGTAEFPAYDVRGTRVV